MKTIITLLLLVNLAGAEDKSPFHNYPMPGANTYYAEQSQKLINERIQIENQQLRHEYWTKDLVDSMKAPQPQQYYVPAPSVPKLDPAMLILMQMRLRPKH